MNKRKLVLPASIILTILYFALPYVQKAEPASSKSQVVIPPGSYLVQKVVDGDTVELKVDGRLQRIRLIGMDTPEVVDPRKVVQCFGREASARAHKLLENKVVRMEQDVQVGERDKYGRLLAYLFLPDGSNYAQGMITDGYAHEYTYQGQFYKYQAEFKQAEQEARDANRGLWAADTCAGDTKQAASQ